jgi:hypothetical protein
MAVGDVERMVIREGGGKVGSVSALREEMW